VTLSLGNLLSLWILELVSGGELIPVFFYEPKLAHDEEFLVMSRAEIYGRRLTTGFVDHTLMRSFTFADFTARHI
jgi:hypothetical protein